MTDTQSASSDPPDLSAFLRAADELNRALWDAIFSAPFDGSIVTHKLLYLAGTLDVALEHQSAINLLIRNHHPGSAMSLVRPIVEAMYKGTWAIAHATELDADKMRRDAFDWPGIGTIVTQADAAYNTGGFFESAKKGNWRTLNSFTHTGGMQLGRRFTQNDLAVNYPDSELRYAVTSTLTAIAILAVPFAASIGRTNDVAKLNTILETLAAAPWSTS